MNDLLVHNEKDSTLAFILANMIHNPELPRPMGVFLASIDRHTKMQMQDQIAKRTFTRTGGPAEALLDGDETWIIE